MESDSRNPEKEEGKSVQGSNERPKSLDLDSSSRSSFKLNNINEKKDLENNDTTRKASPSSHEEEFSSLNAELDSLESQELEDIEERSSNRSQGIARTLKSRIRDLSPSRRTPSPKPERKIRKAKSPTKSTKSPAGWLPASFNQMFSSYKSKSGDFRRLFKELPDSEQLIVDYSCALQRDILVHGRLYISQNWLCFYANIFGWETFVTIKCTDITSIRKEKTALVIPNAVQIITESEKYFFASFISRDTAFTVLFRIWQNALLDQPLSPSELLQMVGKYYESGKEDSDDSDKEMSSDDMSGEEEDNDTEDDDDDDDDDIVSEDEDKSKGSTPVNNSAFKSLSNGSLSTAPELSVTPPSPTQIKLSENDNTSLGRSNVSQSKKQSTSPTSKTPDIKSLLKSKKKDKLKLSDAEDVSSKNHLKESSDMDEEGSVSEFLDEVSTDPHTCMCDKHLATEMLNEVWPVSVDNMYELLFTESNFYKNLQKHRKTRDLVFNPWTKTDDGQHRTITYTVALNYSIGPKSSPTTEFQHCFKGSIPGKVYMVQTEVNNEGIPYGDSFSVVNRYCITKCTEKSSRLRISSEIKYKKSVWGFVKNMIEKNAFDALKEYFTFVGTSLQKETDVDQRNKRRPSPAKRHKRNRSLKSREDILPSPSSTSTISDKASQNVPLWKRTISGLLALRSSLPSMKTENKFALAIAVLLMCLLALNVFLTFRLLALERGAQMRIDWTRDLENLPTDAKQWAQMLQQQKKMHEQQMERWKEILSTSIKLMNQVQDSLSELNKELN